jgi:hypothetical protein
MYEIKSLTVLSSSDRDQFGTAPLAQKNEK